MFNKTKHHGKKTLLLTMILLPRSIRMSQKNQFYCLKNVHILISKILED